MNNNIKRGLIFCALTLLSAQTVSAQSGTKVVVIPLGDSDARCEWRKTEYEPLNTFYRRITSNCLGDEKIITGGFEIGSYSTTKDCRPLESFPRLKSDVIATDGWRVTWGQPSTSECASATARAYALCCK